MFVQQILSRARARLAAIEVGASITEAALLMTRPQTELLVVCDGGIAVGVITKTDIVAQVAQENFASALAAPLSAIMTRDFLSCRASDSLIQVWSALKQHGLQRVPVLDDARQPVGILYARDALQALLGEAEAEDEMLRDYIQGVGYH
jgi:CBS domain-containing protein